MKLKRAHTDPQIIAGGILLGQYEAAKRGQLVIWTIYDRPRDHPQGFIARRVEVGAGKPAPTSTDDVLTGDLEELRNMFWNAGLAKRTRQEGDDPHIVESWI